MVWAAPGLLKSSASVTYPRPSVVRLPVLNLLNSYPPTTSRLWISPNCRRNVSSVCSVTVVLSRRSEEHTSELQSLAYLVCRLLLEKKKKKNSGIQSSTNTKAKIPQSASTQRSP